MKEEKLDKIFKDKVRNHGTPVDTNALWDSIAGQVVSEEKKDRKGFFFWFRGLGGLLLLAGILWGVSFISRQQANSTKVPSNGTESAYAEKLNKSIIKRESTEKLNQQGLKKQVRVGESLEKRVLSDPEVNSTWIDLNEKQNNYSLQTPIGDLTKEHNGGQKEIRENKSVLTEQTLTIAETPNQQFEAKEELLTLPKLDSSVGLFLSIPQKLDLLEPYLVFNRQISLNAPFLPGKQELPQPKPEKPFLFGISGYLSPGVIFKTIRPKTEESNTLLDLRSQSEQTLETMGGGLSFKTRHQSGFWLSTGIDFTQINERFTYYNQTTSYAYSDTSLTIQTRTVEKEIHNHLRLVSIPLRIGYDLEFQQCTVAAGAGILLNLALNSEGTVMGRNPEFVQLGTTEEDIFKTRVGLAYSFSLGVERKLNDHWAVTLTPELLFYPGSFTRDTYSLEQNYRLLKFNAGAVYHF